jgi:hypothetical protein
MVSDQVSKWWKPQPAYFPHGRAEGLARGQHCVWTGLWTWGERNRMKSGGCGAGDQVCAKGGRFTTISSSCDGFPIKMNTTVPAFLFSTKFCSSPPNSAWSRLP